MGRTIIINWTHQTKYQFRCIPKYREDIYWKILFLLFKCFKRYTKEFFVSPANSSQVGILITIGDVTDNRVCLSEPGIPGCIQRLPVGWVTIYIKKLQRKNSFHASSIEVDREKHLSFANFHFCVMMCQISWPWWSHGALLTKWLTQIWLQLTL